MTNPAKENNGGLTEDDGHSFVLQSIQLKDLSFESPNNPGEFAREAADPDVQMNLKNSHQALQDDVYSVSLQLSIHARSAGKTIFLVEVDQVGNFLIKGYSPEETNMIIGTHCPATLFPYARELVSSLVTKGGYPPLVLQHINFGRLYANAQSQNGNGQDQ